MLLFSTEVTSSTIHSDSPLFQRTKKAYELIKEKLYGSVLEIGPGEGYGINLIKDNCDALYAIDKNSYSVKQLTTKFPNVIALQQKVPPMPSILSNSMDFVICFQVIEHIKNDVVFLNEIKRVLKPGGTLFLTTPNKKHTIARNPWHYREYDIRSIQKLTTPLFSSVQIKGIAGNETCNAYYRKNKANVEKIMKWDMLNMQKWLPSFLLKIPYEILNRINRKKLLKENTDLIGKITSNDYSLLDKYSSEVLDFFCIAIK